MENIYSNLERVFSEKNNSKRKEAEKFLLNFRIFLFLEIY